MLKGCFLVHSINPSSLGKDECNEIFEGRRSLKWFQTVSLFSIKFPTDAAHFLQEKCQ